MYGDVKWEKSIQNYSLYYMMNIVFKPLNMAMSVAQYMINCCLLSQVISKQ